MEPWAPVCQRQVEKPLCGRTLGTLGQEQVECSDFSFLTNIPYSFWLSRHNPVAAVSADALNISFLAAQRPCCRAWESSCPVWDVAMIFPDDPWQVVYLPHLQGWRKPSLLTTALAHLQQCVLYLLLCVASWEDCLMWVLQACLQWQWTMVKVLFPGTWCVKMYFTWAITLDYKSNKYSRRPFLASWC